MCRVGEARRLVYSKVGRDGREVAVVTRYWREVVAERGRERL